MTEELRSVHARPEGPDVSERGGDIEYDGTPKGGEGHFVVYPTVIVRMLSDHFGVVTTGKGEDEALVVFRGPEDARKYQEKTGKHAAEEGFELIGMDEEALAALLETQGIGRVAMPEPWTGEGVVDIFEAGSFIALLEDRSSAGEASDERPRGEA